MTIRERVQLASLTTFRIGGEARYVADCENEEDVKAACSFARTRGLSRYVLGEGSNLLASDDGYDGVIIRMIDSSIEQNDEGDDVVVIVRAGAHWDELVRMTTAQGLWGLENLAGIPGTVGAAPVQNIGAYGSEVADTLIYVDAFDQDAGAMRRFTKDECSFGYRESRFKRDPVLIILSAAFRLSRVPAPHISYKDLEARREAGVVLDTPLQIAETVREIRAGKFPDLSECGTAGSFFKNPTVSTESYEALKIRYPELPGFPGSQGVKIPLAYILDHILSLRGFRKDRVRLFETQPLVLVADIGATAREVNALAEEVSQQVFAATGIAIEREVRALL